jgi:hypothetical protein
LESTQLSEPMEHGENLFRFCSRGCRALAHRTGKALPLEPGILVEQA